MKSSFSKFLYIGFLFLSAYQAIFSRDYMQAAGSFGIGLAFDPFNLEQKWATGLFGKKRYCLQI